MSKKQIKGTHSITPLGDNVLLKEIIQKQESNSGIIIPDSANEKTGLNQGTVVAVGDGSYKGENLVPISLKKGDTVLYSWGENFKFENEEYILVKESQIVAVINKSSKK